MSRSKPISDARDLFKGTAEGLKTVSDTLSSYYSDQRDRDQRMDAAETARQKSQTPTSTTSASSTSNPAYKPWSEKVANTINTLYSRAYNSILNVNLHEFNRLHDATVCRICMRVDRRYIYYMSNNPQFEKDDLGWKIICQYCISEVQSTYGFHEKEIRRSLPAEIGYTIRCSNKACHSVTDEVFLFCEKCSGNRSPYIMCSECAFSGAMCNSFTKKHQLRVVARYVPEILDAAHKEW